MPEAIPLRYENQEYQEVTETLQLLTKLVDPSPPPAFFVDCTEDQSSTLNQQKLTRLEERGYKITLYSRPHDWA